MLEAIFDLIVVLLGGYTVYSILKTSDRVKNTEKIVLELVNLTKLQQERIDLLKKGIIDED